jgi:uncharacterized protein (TIGR02246 family)
MSATESEPESAEAAIRSLNRQWETCFANHDLAGLTSLFTKDCVRMPQAGPASVGRPAMEEAYRRDFSEVWKTGASVRLNAGEIIASGEYAFARGADTLIENDKQVSGPGKWLFVYRREPDGGWKFHWVIFNRNE